MGSPSKLTARQTLLPESDVNNLVTINSKTSQFSSQLYKRPILDRLPTLYEVLNRRTEPPLDLWSFYVFMRDYQNAVDYLDFWIDVVTHLRLCKDYVKGLRESLLLSEKLKLSSSEKNTSSDEKHHSSSSEKKSAAEERNSVTSSLLLDALLNEGLLDDKDSKRVSSFLQGNEYINTSDPRIALMFSENQNTTTLPEQSLPTPEKQEQKPKDHYSPISSPRRSYHRHSRSSSSIQEISPAQVPLLQAPPAQKRNSTRILPEVLEKHTQNIKNGNITRATLRSSSKNLLNTYFQETSHKKLAIPDRMRRKIRHDVELQGRDDPDVFEEVKEYVYLTMERENYPFFLQKNAFHNLSYTSCLIRLVLGLFSLFAGFWLSYVFIFINLKPKAIRAIIIAPFLIGVYLLLTFLYKLDPIMVALGFSDNQEIYQNSSMNTGNPIQRSHFIRNIKEPFAKKILRKRALWVMILTMIISAAFSVLFGLVPGYRI